jgi:alpha-L-rhamnosidase
MYQITGNRLVLKNHYNTMGKWCDYIINTAREKRGNNDLPLEIDQYLWNTGFHFGEWLIPSKKNSGGDHEICKVSSVYTAPIFGYASISRMSEIAFILDTGDGEYYSTIARKMKKAIQTGLMKDGRMPVELMGAYVLAIAFDLVPDACIDDFSQRLVSLLEKNDYRLDTGFLATPYLLDALTKIKRKDLAIKLLWQDKPPSWLYQVDKGATAIWEDWLAIGQDGTPIITSNNHYAFGCVDEWIFRNIAGINNIKPGFEHITIQPYIEVPLEWCHRTYMSEYGEISVHWTKDVLEVTIPCNTTATVIWNDKSHEIGSGKYVFT